MPGLVLASAATAYYEPRTRTASAPEREEERPEGQTGTPVTGPSSTEAKLPPLDHIQPIPAPL
jgi:hypothetical protein